MNVKKYVAYTKAYTGQILWPLIIPGRKAVLKQLVVDAAEMLAIGRVLDIGTGPAYLPMGIASSCQNVQVIGIDISPVLIRDAANRIRKIRNNGEISLVIAAAERLPFTDNTFDLIQSTFSFHMWKDKILGLKEIHRVLKPDGHALILVGKPYFLHGFMRHFYFFSNRPSKDINDMCAKSGFSKIAIGKLKGVNGGLRILLTK
jgi:ubiquinone/menaquinone biosynthesis C-methylase UbiE